MSFRFVIRPSSHVYCKTQHLRINRKYMPRSHNSIIQRNLMIMIISKLWIFPI